MVELFWSLRLLFLELFLRIISLVSGILAETVFFSGKLDAGWFVLTVVNVFLIWFQLFGWLFCKVHPGAVVFAVLAAMSIQGSANLQTQWNIVGEFSNLPQEELIEWIKYSTKPGKKRSYYLAVVFPTVLCTTAQSSTQVTSNGFTSRKTVVFPTVLCTTAQSWTQVTFNLSKQSCF